MKIRLIILLSLLLTTVEACAQKDISWKSNGEVFIGNDTIKLKMQNVYYGYKYKDGAYLIGFEIDKQGNNKPTLAWLSETDNSPLYWSFDNILQQVFILNDMPHLLDMNGGLHQFEKQTWIKSSLKLKDNSRIIYTENTILACYPTPLFKSPSSIGGCYTIDGKWEIKVNWRDTLPKVCNEHLVAIDKNKKTLWIRNYSKTSGELLSSSKITKIPDDLCSFSF